MEPFTDDADGASRGPNKSGQGLAMLAFGRCIFVTADMFPAECLPNSLRRHMQSVTGTALDDPQIFSRNGLRRVRHAVIQCSDTRCRFSGKHLNFNLKYRRAECGCSYAKKRLCPAEPVATRSTLAECNASVPQGV
jgi:hypothetical protein